MKKILTAIILIIALFTTKSYSQGALTIHNASNCTIYMTFAAMATSTGDTACSIQGNQIILSPSAGVSYTDAIDFELSMGWQIPGSTVPYISNGIPGDFTWTDVAFNSVCSCPNWINGFLGIGGTNCFGIITSHCFVGKTPDNMGDACIIHACWTYDDSGNPFIYFSN